MHARAHTHTHTNYLSTNQPKAEEMDFFFFFTPKLRLRLGGGDGGGVGWVGVHRESISLINCAFSPPPLTLKGEREEVNEARKCHGAWMREAATD